MSVIFGIRLNHHRDNILYASFLVLFLLYHLAEYMIMFKDSASLFFIFQFMFFGAALLAGHWYSQNGLKAWGLPISPKPVLFVLLGIMLGVILYSVPWGLAIYLDIEKVTDIPSLHIIIKNSLVFAVGVLFTSFSEDILTRGLVYRLLEGKLRPVYIIFISALIYLLNHIYRLNDGLEVLLYLFLLGIVFAIPLINSKNLWITGSMHWAGNLFFFISHNLVQTEEMPGIISYNMLFSIILLIMIPVVWISSKK
ncbi:type II CAAX prenyl endopeptidase Rce1 family protein [Zunongwangia sp. H14]|uniref:CPBP family glutamic-type intramembrane protease n=1 Tax=Zunongwangia sp. H14 TaxID=3240792 RepID=UPI00356526F6